MFQRGGLAGRGRRGGMMASGDRTSSLTWKPSENRNIYAALLGPDSVNLSKDVDMTPSKEQTKQSKSTKQAISDEGSSEWIVCTKKKRPSKVVQASLQTVGSIKRKATPQGTNTTETKETKPSSLFSAEAEADPTAEDFEEPRPDTVGENGDAAFTTTGDPCLDLFFGGMVRGAPEDKLFEMLPRAWAVDPVTTIKVLIHGRDCRGGKGEKEVVLTSLLWLRMHKPLTYVRNLRNFVEHGYFKDLCYMAARASSLKLHPLGSSDCVELELLAEQLREDFELYSKWKEECDRLIAAKDSGAASAEDSVADIEMDSPEGEEKAAAEGQEAKDSEEKRPAKPKKPARVSLSLAAKWAPTENTSFDKQCGLAHRLARVLFPDNKTAFQQYRKMTSALRSHITIVENLMCSQRWDEIRFGQVPSRAHKLHKKTFQKHDADRYNEYLAKLQVGKEKVNTTGLQPHELVSQCMQLSAPDPLVEAQWRTMMDKLKDSGVHLNKAFSLVDVSGSMSGVPMQVAIALGIITAALTREPFHCTCLTFEDSPQFHLIKGDTLFEKVRCLQQAPWGGTTNLDKAFDMMLKRAREYSVPASQMPTTLFIYSDMQFDTATGHTGGSSTFQRAKSRYREHGYTVPNVVFWNLRGNTTSVPTTNENGVALVSGYSPDLLKVFMEDGDFTPVAVMHRAVDKYPADVDPSEV